MDHYVEPNIHNFFLIPALADSPPSGALAPQTALSLRLLEAEKGGRQFAGWVPSIKVGLPAFNFD